MKNNFQRIILGLFNDKNSLKRLLPLLQSTTTTPTARWITTLPRTSPIELDRRDLTPNQTDSDQNEHDDDGYIAPGKLKRHLGKNLVKNVQLPDFLEENINKLVSDYDVASLLESAAKFKHYLINRKTPLTHTEKVKLKTKLIEEKLLRLSEIDERETMAAAAAAAAAQAGTESETEVTESTKNLDKYLMKRILNSTDNDGRLRFQPNSSYLINNDEDEEMLRRLILNKNQFAWNNIDYTLRLSLIYLVAKFDCDYSSMVKIFNEIKRKDDKFEPKCYFEFGSGLGSSMWAARHHWQSSLQEFLNIDRSVHMNSIANLLIRKHAKLNKPAMISNVHFKQNYPALYRREYDLVVCSYTLNDLSDKRERLGTLESLWEKVKENGYLVLVENGSNPGFALMNEARDYFTQRLLTTTNRENQKQRTGHLVAPCPHEKLCPMLNENRSCKFHVSYIPLYLSGFSRKQQEPVKFEYTYLIFKKQQQIINSNEVEDEQQEKRWPRFVLKGPAKAAKTKSKAINSWLCKPDGSLSHLLTSKQRDKNLWRLTKYSELGDELPANISNKESTATEEKEANEKESANDKDKK